MFDNKEDLIKEGENKKASQSTPQGNPAGNAAPRPNAGWLFYKDYYLHNSSNGERVFFGDLGEIKKIKEQIKTERDHKRKEDLENRRKQIEKSISSFFKEKNHILLKCRPGKDGPTHFKINHAQALPLVTGDKGLLTGTGISHETGEIGEFKLGLQFDYATGLPYIPGSSIKGVLRSLFPGHRRTDDKLGETYHRLRRKALTRLLGNIWGTDAATTQTQFETRTRAYLRNPEASGDAYFELLERQIFEGEVPIFDKKSGLLKKDAAGKPVLSPDKISMRDLFFDAYIETADNAMLAEEVITPHKKPLQDPVPLSFVKIAADVTFCFQFDLKGNELLNTEEKLKVFTEILKTFGAGAKRRHGFGELK